MSVAARQRPVRRLAALIRWDEWSTSKLPLVALIGYVCLLDVPPEARVLGQWALLLLGTAALGAFGYLANDLSDLAVDELAGKARESHRWNRRVAVAVCTGAAMASVISYCLANPSLGTLLVALGAVGLAGAYSARPIRLKERGLLGVVVAAAAQRALPGLVAAEIFRAATPAFWLLLVAITLHGVRYILLHQLADAGHDLRTGVRSFAVEVGTPTTLRILDALPVAEVLLIGIAMALPPISSAGLSLLFVPSLVGQLRRIAGQPLATRVSRRFKTSDLRAVYFLLLPAVIVGVLVSRDTALYLPLAALEISWKWRLWRDMFSRPLLNGNWITRRQGPPAARP